MSVFVGQQSRSLEAEISVVGAILIEPQVIEVAIAGGLAPEEFGSSVHGEFYRLMLALHAAGTPIDLVTMAEAMRKEDGLNPEVARGGLEMLSNTMSAVPSAANITVHVTIVREHAARRSAQVLADGIVQQGAGLELASIAELFEKEAAKLHALASPRQKTGMRTMKESARSVFKQLEVALMPPAERDKDPEYHAGFETGLVTFDGLTARIRKKKFYIIAARSGIGKTSLKIRLMRGMAARGTRCAFFSLEMPETDITRRTLAQAAGVDEQRIRDGDVNDLELARLIEETRRLVSMPIFIDDRPHTLASLISEARRMKREEGVEVFFVDYIQKVKNRKNSASFSREQEVSEISGAMPDLAKDLDVAMVCGAQLNRGMEKGSDIRKPRLADLRESGSLEQDADAVLLLHRDRNAQTAAERAVCLVIQEKSRYTAPGEIELVFEGRGTQFHDKPGSTESDPDGSSVFG